jgi:hypothetical protein
MALLALPFIIIGHVNIWLALIPGIPLALLILIISAAFFGTFGSSVWTLGFMKITGYAKPKKTKAAQPSKA